MPPLTLDGTTGVSAIQTGAVESGDLASGAIGSGDLPAGSVIQVVSNSTSSDLSTASSSFVDTNLSATITPILSSSTILVFTYQFGRAFDTVGSPVGEIQLLREDTVLTVSRQGASEAGDQGVPQYYYTNSFCFSDTSATAPTTTYKTQFRSLSGTFQINGAGGIGRTSTITLMEIAG